MEDDEVAGARLREGAAHRPGEQSEAGRARHAARETGREHPRRGGMEVDLIWEAQRIARDALVPGLAGDDVATRVEGDPPRELQARVDAVDVPRPQRVERGPDRGNLPHPRREGRVAPALGQEALTRGPGKDEAQDEGGGRPPPHPEPGDPDPGEGEERRVDAVEVAKP